MSILIFLVGFIIVTATILDILYTVLAPNGSGLITGKLSYWIWRSSLALSGSDGKSWLLSNIGVFMLIFIVQIWVALIWLGNAIIVYADPEALYNSSQTAYQSDFISKLYFSGYVLSAMGHGDYSPVSDWWKFYTAFVSFTGVIFISLAISYLIPVIQAVTNKRAFSLKVASIGKSPENMLVTNWKQDDFKFLIEQIHELKSGIFKLAQQHLAYPIVHYFHSKHRYESTSICLAMIDETITILETIKDTENDDSPLTDKLKNTRLAITYYLSTLKGSYIDPEDDAPEVPKLDYLDEHKIPTEVDEDQILKNFERHITRRKMLLAYVQNDAWEWKDVVEEHSTIEIEDKN